MSPRGLRRAAVLAALGMAVVDASPSQAYKLGGAKWPTRTITYHSATPEFDGAIAAAVRVWNTSGARVHFKQASARRARLHIIHGKNLGAGANGLASLGVVAPDVVTRRTVAGVPMSGYPVPCGTRLRGPFGKPARPMRAGPARLAAAGREDGGAEPAGGERDDEDRRPRARPRARAQPRRQPLRDHVAGRHGALRAARGVAGPLPDAGGRRRARRIARYGGSMKPLPPAFCDLAAPPVPPTNLAATFDADFRVIRFTWTNAGDSSVRTVATAVQRDGCATEPPPYRSPATPGAADAGRVPVDNEPAGGTASAVVRGRVRRLSAPTTAWRTWRRAAARVRSSGVMRLVPSPSGRRCAARAQRRGAPPRGKPCPRHAELTSRRHADRPGDDHGYHALTACVKDTRRGSCSPGGTRKAPSRTDPLLPVLAQRATRPSTNPRARRTRSTTSRARQRCGSSICARATQLDRAARRPGLRPGADAARIVAMNSHRRTSSSRTPEREPPRRRRRAGLARLRRASVEGVLDLARRAAPPRRCDNPP